MALQYCQPGCGSFYCPSCVYSPVFSFNVVPAAECSSDDGWWWLKHAERRVKSQYTLFFSVPRNNRWNKVFLSVSGELQCHEWVFHFQVTHQICLFLCNIYFSLEIIVNYIEFLVCNVSYSFFSALGGRMCHMSSWAPWCFSGSMMSSYRSREERARQQRDSGREEKTKSKMWAAHSEWFR